MCSSLKRMGIPCSFYCNYWWLASPTMQSPGQATTQTNLKLKEKRSFRALQNKRPLLYMHYSPSSYPTWRLSIWLKGWLSNSIPSHSLHFFFNQTTNHTSVSTPIRGKFGSTPSIGSPSIEFHTFTSWSLYSQKHPDSKCSHLNIEWVLWWRYL